MPTWAAARARGEQSRGLRGALPWLCSLELSDVSEPLTPFRPVGWRGLRAEQGTEARPALTLQGAGLRPSSFWAGSQLDT